MRKIGIVMILTALLLTGCNVSASSGIVGTDTAHKDKKIKADFVQIDGESNLYYNVDTHVVYWIGGSYKMNMLGDDYTTSYMTAYFAPNGKPYVYNVELQQMEEIE